MIVTRGLGKRGTLVTLGLGLVLQVQVVAPEPVEPRPILSHSAPAPKKAYSALRVVTSFTLPEIHARTVLETLEAAGSGSAKLVQVSGSSAVSSGAVSAAAQTAILQIPYTAVLEPLVGAGRKDLSDEEIVALVLASLQI